MFSTNALCSASPKCHSANFISIAYKMEFISSLNLPNSHACVIMQDLMLPMWSSLFVLYGEMGLEGVREKGRSARSGNDSVTTSLLSTARSVYESRLFLTSTA